MKGYTWFISKRMHISQQSRRKSPSVIVATIGVALSLAIMIVSVAIVSGFKGEIRNKVIGFNSAITLYPTYSSQAIDDNLIELTTPLRDILDNQEYIKSYSLVSSLPAILKTPSDFKGIYLRGVSDTNNLKFISDNIVQGNLSDLHNNDSNSIILSQYVADQLHLSAGDEINAYFISDNIRVRKFKVSVIYNTHFEDYDELYAFCDIRQIQDLCGFTSTQGSSIEITTYNPDNIADDTSALFNVLSNAAINGKLHAAYRVDNVLNSAASYFGWLALLDTNVVVILILMAAVACFTLISALLILILEKVHIIGTLKTLGASNGDVSAIFLQLSLKIGLTGMLLADFISISFLILQDKFHFIKLDPASYYIDFVPVAINITHIVIINIATLFLIWMALIVPSRLVSKIQPSKVLKYE